MPQLQKEGGEKKESPAKEDNERGKKRKRNAAFGRTPRMRKSEKEKERHGRTALGVQNKGGKEVFPGQKGEKTSVLARNSYN